MELVEEVRSESGKFQHNMLSMCSQADDDDFQILHRCGSLLCGTKEN